MTINSLLSTCSVDHLGTSYGNYLRYDEGINRWSIVHLNRLDRCLRSLGCGFQSTKLDFVAHQLASSDERNIDAALLAKVHASWNKKFPTIQSPLSKKVEPFTRIHVLSPSDVQNIAPETMRVGKTFISIEGGKLLEAKVEALILPTIKLPNYPYLHRMEESFSDLSRALGFDLGDMLVRLWEQSPNSADPFPPISTQESLSIEGIKKILLPKKLPPIPTPGSEFVSEQDKKEQDIAFFKTCLSVAHREGVRSFAYCPRDLARGDIKLWTENDLQVIEEYVHEHPDAFDEIKLIYKFDTARSAHELASAISTCRAMVHLFAKAVDA